LKSREFDEIKKQQGLAAAVEAARKSGCRFSSNGRRVHFEGGGSRLTNLPPSFHGSVDADDDEDGG
jgi:hypothetical protein